MTIFEYLNIKPQYLNFSDEKIYAYGDILINLESGELITLNTEDTIAKQLKVTEYPFTIKDKNGNQLYSEDSKGYWDKREYNNHGKLTHYINSRGYWEKIVYDTNGYPVRFEHKKNIDYLKKLTTL
jgi:hypothetical protein